MNNNYHILIIENQIKQYHKMREYLSGYTIFPDPNTSEKFEKFLNHVKIALNDRYNICTKNPTGERQNSSKEYLIKYIKDNLIDLIIIDHILVGHPPAKNGIDLGHELKKEFQEIPIIFLSRSDKSKEEVKSRLYEDDIWIEKGYGNVGINDPNYFEQYVIKEIKRLLIEEIKKMVNKIKESVFFSQGHRSNFSSFENNTKLNYKHKKLLKEFTEDESIFKLKTNDDLNNLAEELKKC